RLYPSLFANADKHIQIIRLLSTVNQGLTRQQIIKKGKLSDGGSTSKVLLELEQSGFITAYYPFARRKKDKLFRLTDEYSLFYLRFIEPHKHDGENTWKYLSQTQAYKTWSGYAYENVCFAHIPQIKTKLGISGILTKIFSYVAKPTDDLPGTQIDLLIDRIDHTIHLCEVKFS
ncbi:MAG: ATP-binding protein, partial [Chitinophagales bacterium]